MDEKEGYSAKLLLNLINSLSSPIFIKNTKHELIFVNKALCQMLGRDYGDLIGKSDYDLSPKEEADVFWEMDDKVFESREENINEEFHTDALGYTRVIQTKKIIFEDVELGDCLCGVITDVTELKQLNEKLRKIAFQDSITGLMNKAAFDQAAIRYLNNFNSIQQKFALLIIVMEGLTFVNESYGQTVGDRLIQETGSRIFNTVPLKGVVARIGGNEFMLLIPYQERQEIMHITQHILAELKKPIALEKRKLLLASNIGIACCPEDGRSVTALVSHASSSMHEAKNECKAGSYAFYQKVYSSHQKTYATATKRKLELENDLRVALENNQLEVHFQPIFDDNQVVGYESLSRWFSPEFGTVSPDEFIPIAEQSDLILLLGEQIMEAAIEFIDNNCLKGEYVSVNVSPVQLKHATFKKNLECIVNNSSGASSSRQLVIEVTERLMMGMNEHIASLINSPILKDIKYFIDDFGTGYSNLAQLKKLKFDTVKIDKEFIKGLPTSDSDISIIKSIVFMAKEFNMKVIAEGVETEEQKRCLSDIGCNYFQGFLLGAPALQECWG